MLRSSMSSAQRACWAAVFALLISMRLLIPQGFMPVVDAGHVTVTLCDDAVGQIEAATHHGHSKKDKAKHRPSCPYAAASAQTFLDPPTTAVPVPLAFASTEIHSRSLTHDAVQQQVQRPPSRAPPVLAY